MPFLEDVRAVMGDWAGGLAGGGVAIHRDLHGNNVIYGKEDGKLKAILDFDTICVGPADYDLAYSGLFFSTDIPRPFQTPDVEMFNLFWERYVAKMDTLSDGGRGVGNVRDALKDIRRDMVNRTSAVIMSRYFREEEIPDGPIANHLGIHRRMRDLEG
jgi:aminoglycoside phosphotransferase (APT) family kinase protein